MTFKPKRKDGSVRMIEQLRAEFPNESPWVYVRGKGPHWKSSVSGRVVLDLRKPKQSIASVASFIDYNKGTVTFADVDLGKPESSHILDHTFGHNEPAVQVQGVYNCTISSFVRDPLSCNSIEETLTIDNNKGTAVAAWLSQEFGDGLVVEEIVPFKISIEETLGDVIKGSDE